MFKPSLFVSFLFAFLLVGCEDNPTSSDEPYDFLSIDSTSYRSIYLRVEGHADGSACFYRIFRGNDVRWEGDLFGGDTILVDYDCVRGVDYRYLGYRFSMYDGSITDSTGWLTARLGDYSSNAFSLDIQAYGSSQSTFNTAISLSDGTVLVGGIVGGKGGEGNLVTYTMEKDKWYKSTLYFYLPVDGQELYVPDEIAALGAVGDSSIWAVSVNGAVAEMGGPFGVRSFPSSVNLGEGIHAVWGNSADNVYFGGKAGVLWHYDGQEFRTLSTGVSLDIRDIVGENEPMIIASADGENGASGVYTIANGALEPQYPGISLPPGLRSGNGDVFVGTGGGYLFADGMLTPVPAEGSWSGTSVRGIWHDYVAAGPGGTLMHFDGQSWNAVGTNLLMSDVDFKAVAFAHNGTPFLCAAGTRNGYSAILVFGRQQ